MSATGAWDLASAISSASVLDRTEALNDGPLSDDAWRRLVTMVSTERLAGALADAVQGARLAVTDSQAHEAQDLHRRAMATVLVRDRTLLEVAGELRAHDIDFVVLKGAAAAHLDYPTPALRSYGDVDLLIAGAQIDDARRLLEQRGGTRLYPQRQDDFDRRFTKSVTVRMPDRVELDLHRTLASGPFGLTIDLDELGRARDAFVIGGVELPALGRTRRFVHACYHATLGRGRSGLVPLCDVVVTAPMDERELHVVDALVRHWGAQVVVAHALDDTVATLGWQLPAWLARWRSEFFADARRERWLSAYRGPQRHARRLAFYSIEALPSLRERVSYGGALARSSAAARHAASRVRRSAGLRSPAAG